MKSKNIWIIGIMLYFVVACYQSVLAQETILFGGGPTSGTFIIFANGVETYGPIQTASEFEVLPISVMVKSITRNWNAQLPSVKRS